VANINTARTSTVHKIKYAQNIRDLRQLARHALPKGLFEFVDRGTEDEVALTAIRSAFEAIKFRPRVLANVSQRTQATTFFGKPSSMPLAIAPTGAAGLLYLDGEIAVARAAAKAGIPFTLSTASIVPMERVAQEAGGTLWFQLYMWPDKDMSFRLVDRARQAGYEALIVTVDSAATPNREYNVHNGFTFPISINHRNAIDVALSPAWLCSVFIPYLLRFGIPVFENYPEVLRKKFTTHAGQGYVLPRNDSLTWDDLRLLRKKWDGPLMLKGVLHPEDAAMAVDCGLDAVIVSSHGGRNFDSALPPIRALSHIVERVNGKAAVFLDSGVQRGSDVVKALALGATGAFAGRAALWGVAAGGEDGSARAIAILRDEIHRSLGFLGCANLAQLLTMDIIAES
jgi:isopentenyl diphosphate isomerase/L-lactate dehydrogenase-like FMN-dependent dehydrogenase